MTPAFLNDDFLLGTSRARELYHAYAAPLPIIDYHCHLSPGDIARNRQFENLTRIWLEGDHYKWRAMRACGVPERCITGDASDREKFERWAETVPKTLRNPLFHWTHLELRRPFGIVDRLLNPSTAREIWDACNTKLALQEFAARGILTQMNVEVVCTTDDPVDSLEHHLALQEESAWKVRILPTFRPDRAMAVGDPKQFLSYVNALTEAADQEILGFEDFLAALRKRHDHFHRAGCRLSDHGLETLPVEEYTDGEVETVFGHLLASKDLREKEVLKFRSAMLHEFALMDREKGWVMQLHLGALRNANTRMLNVIGPDTGFDSIGDFDMARPLATFLDRLDAGDRLPKTILYNLNPRDNEVLASMIGNFQDGSVPGKMQYGPAWWFMDQMDGMKRQMEALSTMGLLSQFVGMVTDSRSFLSYSRHEYFRRLLCDTLGAEMQRGQIPDDMDLMGGMVRDICYFNPKRYFGFGEEKE